MDIDVFPNSLEYWGPNGMVFYRNVQVRWMPIEGETRLTFALERPGATADGGEYQERLELEDIKARFPVPDISGEYRLAGKPNYEQVSQKDGKPVLRAATPIPVVMEKCVMCHENYRGKKVIGALGYTLPLDGAKAGSP